MVLVEIPSIYESMTKSEKEVADFLKERGIWWIYEQPLFVTDDKLRPRLWTPDFFLPDFGIYIEVCGNSKTDYSFRKMVYKLEETVIIFLHTYKDGWKFFLKKRLQEIHEKRNKMLKGI